MASYMNMPREGYLEAVLHVFEFLVQKYNSRMAFDPTYTVINMNDFKECTWKDYYGYLKEAIPPNAPKERGKYFDLCGYVDREHAGENNTRRYLSGFFIFLNTALIQWFSNSQAMIETSMFGTEFVAMKIFMETLQGIKYNLRMIGVPIYGLSYIYGDNMVVIYNTKSTDTTLKKKSNSIFYHTVRRSIAMDESLTEHVKTKDNCND